jgi:AcrR family transcriptional regulator
MRHRIVTAGTDAFAERGFAGASVREIANRVGITQGRFFRYFHAKTALLDEVATAAIAQLTEVRDEVVALARDELDIRRFMKSYGRIIERHLHRHHAWYVLWLQQPPISEPRKLQLNTVSQEICDLLAEAIAVRSATPDPVMVATVFNGALFSAAMFKTLGFDEMDGLPARVVDGCVVTRKT